MTETTVTILATVKNIISTVEPWLESILNQVFKGKYDILIIDSCSNDGTEKILEAYSKKYNNILVKSYESIQPKALNYAITNFNINGEYIALIDGDCVASKNWLQTLVDTIKEKNVDAVGGVGLTPDDVNLFQKIIGFDLDMRFLSTKEGLVKRHPNMNLLIKKDVLKSLKFNEKYIVGYDTEFGYRLNSMGYKLWFNPKAVVYHYHRSSILGYIKQQFLTGKFAFKFYLSHKDKIAGDNINPASMIIQPVLFLLSVASAILMFFDHRLAILFLLLLLSMLTIFTFNILKSYHIIKNPYVISLYLLYILRINFWLFGAMSNLFTFNMYKDILHNLNYPLKLPIYLRERDKMKVTLIRGRSTDSAIYKVADTLHNNGYNVRLLVWNRQNITIEDKKYALKKFNLKAHQDNWMAYLYFPIWSLYELFYLLMDDSDIIHACDLDTLLPAIIVKSIKKKKLFYTVYDFYANNLLINNSESLTSKIVCLFQSIVSTIEHIGIGFTDALFLVDECRFDEVKGSKIKKLQYIYNSPPDYSNFTTKEDRCNELILLYIGLIHKNRGLEYIIKAVDELDGIKLLIGGTGPDLDIITNIKNKGKIEYMGWVPSYDNVLKMSSEADVIFRFNDPKVPKSKYESPNKLFEAMMCGKPIIINSELAASRIVANENCGITIPYGNVDAIKEVLLKLKNDVDLRYGLGKNGREAYVKKYSWKIMETRLLDVYKCS